MADDGNSDLMVERTLCQLPFVHVFKIGKNKTYLYL